MLSRCLTFGVIAGGRNTVIKLHRVRSWSHLSPLSKHMQRDQFFAHEVTGVTCTDKGASYGS